MCKHMYTCTDTLIQRGNMHAYKNTHTHMHTEIKKERREGRNKETKRSVSLGWTGSSRFKLYN